MDAKTKEASEGLKGLKLFEEQHQRFLELCFRVVELEHKLAAALAAAIDADVKDQRAKRHGHAHREDAVV